MPPPQVISGVSNVYYAYQLEHGYRVDAGDSYGPRWSKHPLAYLGPTYNAGGWLPYVVPPGVYDDWIWLSKDLRHVVMEFTAPSANITHLALPVAIGSVGSRVLGFWTWQPDNFTVRLYDSGGPWSGSLLWSTTSSDTSHTGSFGIQWRSSAHRWQPTGFTWVKGATYYLCYEFTNNAGDWTDNGVINIMAPGPNTPSTVRRPPHAGRVFTHATSIASATQLAGYVSPVACLGTAVVGQACYDALTSYNELKDYFNDDQADSNTQRKMNGWLGAMALSWEGESSLYVPVGHHSALGRTNTEVVRSSQHSPSNSTLSPPALLHLGNGDYPELLVLNWYPDAPGALSAGNPSNFNAEGLTTNPTRWPTVSPQPDVTGEKNFQYINNAGNTRLLYQGPTYAGLRRIRCNSPSTAENIDFDPTTDDRLTSAEGTDHDLIGSPVYSNNFSDRWFWWRAGSQVRARAMLSVARNAATFNNDGPVFTVFDGIPAAAKFPVGMPGVVYLSSGGNRTGYQTYSIYEQQACVAVDVYGDVHLCVMDYRFSSGNPVPTWHESIPVVSSIETTNAPPAWVAYGPSGRVHVFFLSDDQQGIYVTSRSVYTPDWTTPELVVAPTNGYIVGWSLAVWQTTMSFAYSAVGHDLIFVGTTHLATGLPDVGILYVDSTSPTGRYPIKLATWNDVAFTAPGGTGTPVQGGMFG